MLQPNANVVLGHKRLIFPKDRWRHYSLHPGYNPKIISNLPSFSEVDPVGHDRLWQFYFFRSVASRRIQWHSKNPLKINPILFSSPKICTLFLQNYLLTPHIRVIVVYHPFTDLHYYRGRFHQDFRSTRFIVSKIIAEVFLSKSKLSSKSKLALSLNYLHTASCKNSIQSFICRCFLIKSFQFSKTFYQILRTIPWYYMHSNMYSNS